MDENLIRVIAYLLWEERQKKDIWGTRETDWHTAERIVDFYSTPAPDYYDPIYNMEKEDMAIHARFEPMIREAMRGQNNNIGREEA